MPILKRKSARIKVNLPILIESGSINEEAVLVEISREGCSVRSSVSLNPSSNVLLTFYRRKDNGFSYWSYTPVSAKVMYKVRSSIKNSFKYGFEFMTAINEDHGVQKIIESN